MSLNKVSQSVLSAISSVLGDQTAGFNPGIVANAPNYQLPTFVQLDFSSTSKNFLLSQVDPALIDETGILTYPFACLYIKESAQTNTQKFNQFSGQIRAILEVNLSWTNIKGLQNTEAYCNCVEDVVIDVMNRTTNQNWPFPVVYNGMIQTKRGSVLWGSQNFKQSIGFSMIFEVHQ